LKISETFLVISQFSIENFCPTISKNLENLQTLTIFHKNLFFPTISKNAENLRTFLEISQYT